MKMPRSVQFAQCDECVTLKDFKRLATHTQAIAYWDQQMEKHRDENDDNRRVYMRNAYVLYAESSFLVF